MDPHYVQVRNALFFVFRSPESKRGGIQIHAVDRQKKFVVGWSQESSSELKVPNKGDWIVTDYTHDTRVPTQGYVTKGVSIDLSGSTYTNIIGMVRPGIQHSDIKWRPATQFELARALAKSAFGLDD